MRDANPRLPRTGASVCYQYFTTLSDQEIVYPPVFTLTDTMNPEEDLLKPELL